jgi:uncharacterized protein
VEEIWKRAKLEMKHNFAIIRNTFQMPNDFYLIISLISLGFLGGFTHCVGMCGPFVITQVSNRMEKISLENFSNLTRLKNLALIPYQLGRISTYSLLGFFCSFFTKNIQDFIGFKILSLFFLGLAIAIFASLLFEKKPHFLTRFKLRFKSGILESAPAFFSKKTSSLFSNPKGFKGYLLGLILGFIPCGLLYSAFLIAATFHNSFLAAFGMFLFGISTFPSLFLTACGSNVFRKIPEFKLVIKVVILLNILTLIMMAGKIIF